MHITISAIRERNLRARKILDWKKISKIPYKPVEGLPRVKPQVPSHRVLQKLPEALKTLCEHMAATCLLGDGIGLAAPQIGTNVAIIAILDSEAQAMGFFFNPNWLPTTSNKTKKTAPEGCLSVAGKNLEIDRFEEIEAR